MQIMVQSAVISKFHGKKVIAYLAEMVELTKNNKKRCSRCNNILDLALFSKNKLKPGGYSHICGICQMTDWYKKHNKMIPSRQEIAENIYRIFLRTTNADHRICKGCHKDLPIVHFTGLDRSSWATFIDHCDECYQKIKNKRRYSRSQTGLKLKKRKKVRIWAIRCIRSHAIRGMIVEINVNNIIDLVSEDGVGVCYYTGDEIRVGYGASIDLKDPRGRFTLSNICLTSHVCNSTKSAMSENEFKQYLLDQPKVIERLRKHNEEAFKRYYASMIPLAELKRIATKCQK